MNQQDSHQNIPRYRIPSWIWIRKERHAMIRAGIAKQAYGLGQELGCMLWIPLREWSGCHSQWPMAATQHSGWLSSGWLSCWGIDGCRLSLSSNESQWGKEVWDLCAVSLHTPMNGVWILSNGYTWKEEEGWVEMVKWLILIGMGEGEERQRLLITGRGDGRCEVTLGSRWLNKQWELVEVTVWRKPKELVGRERYKIGQFSHH